ncbi:ubiquitin-conjugating enzyme E2 [Streptomyces sp. NPDC059002]|uniref:ubiquitin-conjugating enzyme E2 n=1 Tax=Streptomyces sp. NPDC059002 TaxID=3346690 RepID=UPI0036A89ED0
MKALKRITRELRDLSADPPDGILAGCVGQDMFHWQGRIIGPPGTPYEGGTFFQFIRFPTEYPSLPPKLLFETRIYHVNVNANGAVGLPLLRGAWDPAMTAVRVLLEIRNLLSEPDPGKAFAPPDVVALFRSDRSAYDAEAREWTRKYAM